MPFERGHIERGRREGSFTDPRKTVTPFRGVEGPQFNAMEEAAPKASWWDKLTGSSKDQRKEFSRQRRALTKELREQRWQLARQDKFDAPKRAREREKFKHETYRQYNVLSYEAALARKPDSVEWQRKVERARELADKEIQRVWEKEDRALERAMYAREREFRDKRAQGLREIRDQLGGKNSDSETPYS
jgi:hypothetical protein